MTDIPLREHFKERLDLEARIREERYDAYLREQAQLAKQCDERWQNHGEKHDLEAKALELQARENERRLDKLNHDHERTKETQATYLPRELYDTAHSALERRVRDVEDFKSNLLGKLVIIVAIVSAVAAFGAAYLARILTK